MADRTRAAVRPEVDDDAVVLGLTASGRRWAHSTGTAPTTWNGADDGPSRGVDVAPHLPVGPLGVLVAENRP